MGRNALTWAGIVVLFNKKNKISVGVIKSLGLNTPDDKILITANNQEYNLTNSDTATIESIQADGNILLTDNCTISADFESISFATTSHKSQGQTCDHAILVVAK